MATTKLFRIAKYREHCNLLWLVLVASILWDTDGSWIKIIFLSEENLLDRSDLTTCKIWQARIINIHELASVMTSLNPIIFYPH